MLNKPYLTVIAVLLALCAALSYFVYAGAVSNGKLEQSNKVLTDASKRAAERLVADRKVLVARQAALTAQARSLQRDKLALQEALNKNREWANQPVPKEVQEALDAN